MTEGKDPKTGRFLPGNSGFNGRPKGSRNKLGEAFIEDFYNDWMEHGKDVIAAVRRDRPQDILRAAVQLMPTELKITKEDNLSDAELDRRISERANALGIVFREAGIIGASSGETAPDSTH